jgi:hypothetical protein
MTVPLDMPESIYSLDRDTTVRSWLSPDQAETDTAYRRYKAAEAILDSMGIAKDSAIRAMAIQAVKEAEKAYDQVVKIDHWVPTSILNEMHLRLASIESQAHTMVHDLAKVGMVPLSLPVASIRALHGISFRQAAEDFAQVMDHPDYPFFDPREHIVPKDGYEYCIHLEVRARRAAL